jgi:hypothetical protein
MLFISVSICNSSTRSASTAIPQQSCVKFNGGIIYFPTLCTYIPGIPRLASVPQRVCFVYDIDKCRNFLLCSYGLLLLHVLGATAAEMTQAIFLVPIFFPCFWSRRPCNSKTQSSNYS